MSAPRLNAIDGTALGKSLMSTYVTSVKSLTGCRTRAALVAGNPIVRAVEELVRYARGDADLETDDVDQHMLKIMPLLEHPLGGQLPSIIRLVLYDTIDPDALTKGEVLDELALVIAAALGRQALAGERDIRTSWLAAHASVALKTVERAKLHPARRGMELGTGSWRPVKGWITTKEARSWLVTRNDGAELAGERKKT